MQIFAEIRPNPSEETFTERKRDALTTPQSDGGHTPYARVTEEMKLNEEAKQACAITAYSSFCVESLAITKVSRLHTGAD